MILLLESSFLLIGLENIN